MTLVGLLEDLENRLPSCAGFKVVTFRKSQLGADDLKPDLIVGVYADDPSEDIILRVGDSGAPGAQSLTVLELLRLLQSLQEDRAQFEVECSSDEPTAEWRLDFPLAGIAENSSAKLVALVTA